MRISKKSKFYVIILLFLRRKGIGNKYKYYRAKKAAKAFAKRWEWQGYEKGRSQPFWIDLLTNVFEIKDITSFLKTLEKNIIDYL